MANRPSTIDRLDPEIRDIIERLRQHGKTLDEIREHLRSMEIEVSRSALGRHVQGMEKVGERVRRSRAIARGLADQLGDAAESKVASLNIELLHSFIYDFMAAADAEDEMGAAHAALLRDPKAVALFAEATQRLTQASRTNLDFIQKIEERAAEKERRAAALRAETTAKEKGLTGATIAAIKASILGVKAS